MAHLLEAAHRRPRRGLLTLHTETVIAAPVDRVFAFFADAGNLERLTPPWLRFRIRTPAPIAMRAGVEIDYAIRVHGVPVPWRSRIDVWEPGTRFVDAQVVGPYRWWVHEHRFEPGPDGVKVVDHVEYLPRAAWLTAAWVRRDLERIFAFRRQALIGIFGEGITKDHREGREEA